MARHNLRRVRFEEMQKTIRSVSFKKQENQVKQDNPEDIEKNVIRSLKKLDTSYNPHSLN